MTALVTFAQDFQDFHLVRGDRFAPFKHQIPRFLAGLWTRRMNSYRSMNATSIGINRLL